jgi:hypothetical protein
MRWDGNQVANRGRSRAGPGWASTSVDVRNKFGSERCLSRPQHTERWLRSFLAWSLRTLTCETEGAVDRIAYRFGVRTECDFEFACDCSEGSAIDDGGAAGEGSQFFDFEGVWLAFEQFGLGQVDDAHGGLQRHGFLGAMLAERAEEGGQHGVQQSAGPRLLGGELGQHVQIEHDLVGDIEWKQCFGGGRMQYGGSAGWIEVHIEFGGGRNIADASGRTAEDNHLVDQIDHARIALEGSGDSGEWSEAEYGDVTGFGFEAIDDEFIAAHHMLPLRGGQTDIAEAIGPVQIASIVDGCVFWIRTDAESGIARWVQFLEQAQHILAALGRFDGA